MNLVNFAPVPGACKGYAATSTALAAVQVTKQPQTDLYVYNSSSTDPMFLEIGDSNVVATEATTSAAGSLIIPPGSLQILRGQRGGNNGVWISVIMSATKTGTLFVAPGNGS